MIIVTAAKAERIIWMAYAEKKAVITVLRAKKMGNQQDTHPCGVNPHRLPILGAVDRHSVYDF